MLIQSFGLVGLGICQFNNEILFLNNSVFWVLFVMQGRIGKRNFGRFVKVEGWGLGSEGMLGGGGRKGIRELLGFIIYLVGNIVQCLELGVRVNYKFIYQYLFFGFCGFVLFVFVYVVVVIEEELFFLKYRIDLGWRMFFWGLYFWVCFWCEKFFVFCFCVLEIFDVLQFFL